MRSAYCSLLVWCLVFSSLLGVFCSFRVSTGATNAEVSSSTMTSISALPEKQPRWMYQSVGTVNVVSVSSGGLYVAMGTSDGYVYLFNSGSNIPLSANNVGGSVSVLGISYNGRYVAATTGNTLKVYNITGASLAFLWSFVIDVHGSGGVHSLSFAADDEILAVGTWKSGGYSDSKSWVYLFNVTTGSAPVWSKIVNQGGGYDYVSVDISYDARYVVGGSTQDHKVYLFNQTSSVPIYTYDTGAAVNSISASANGHYFVAGSNQVYYFGKDLAVPIWSRSIGGSVTSVSMSSDSTLIGATTGNYLYLLKSDNSELWNYNLESSVGLTLISDEGEYAITRSGNYVTLFSVTADGVPETPAHEPFWKYDAKTTVNSVSVSSDGKFSVAGSGTFVYLFDTDYDPDLTPLSVLVSDEIPIDGDTITISAIIKNKGNLDSPSVSIRFSFDTVLVGTTQIASISKGQNITTSISCTVSPAGLHEINVIADPLNLIHESNETNNILIKTINVDASLFVDTGANPISSVVTQTGTVSSVSISSNGYYIVAGTTDNRIHVFFRNHTTPRWSYDIGGSVSIVKISKDGSYIAATTEKTLYVFSRTRNAPLWSFVIDVHGSGGVYSLSFSADGTMLAVGTWKSGGYTDSKSWIYLFDVTTGSTPVWGKIVNQGGGYDYVSVDISYDARYVVGGSTQDHKVYLFNQTSPTPLYAYDTGSAVNSVSTSMDGEYFVAGSNYVYYFDKDVVVPLWSHDIGGTVSLVSMSNDSAYIASATGTYLHLLKNDNTELWNHNVATNIGQVFISTDNSHIVLRSGNYAYLFSRVTDGNLTTPAHDPIWSYDTKTTLSSISVSSDGRYTILSSSGKIFLFDVKHKADLTLTNISFSSDKPNEGETITIYVSVNNTGAYKSYYTNASFYDGTTLIGRTQIDPISSNSSIVASKTYQCVAGTRTIRILIDPDNVIYESDKTNNELTTTIFVNSRPTPVTLYSPSEITTTTMKLTWTTSAEPDFAEYQIFQSTTSGQLDSLIGTVKEKATINYVVSGLSGSTTYYFTVRVVDANGGTGDSNQVSATTLPTPVILSSPTNQKTSSLDLAWTKNMDQSFTKYEIYRSTSQGQLGNLITSITNQAQTTYTATGLSASTTYYFTIRVVNPKNSYSDSNQVSGTTAPTTSTLSNPTNPKTTSLDLSWSKNTDQGFAKYEIYQSTTSGQIGTLIATITDSAQTTYTARSLSASTTYYFVIRTYNIQGIFSTSNQAVGTTLPTPVTLSNPSNLRQTSMQLSWTKNVDNDFSKYEIYRSTSQSQIGTLVATINNQTQIYYNVTGLTPSTTYFFIIRTVNSKNLFSDSNQVTGTTMAIPVPTPVTLNNPSNPTLSSLYLTWSKNNDLDFLKYEIYKSQSSGSIGSLIATINNQSTISYNATGLKSSTTYYFTVRVTNQQGGYSDSNQVSNTTLGGVFPPVDLSLLLGIFAVFLLVAIPALYVRHKRSQKAYASYTPPPKPKEDTVIYGKPGSGTKTPYITLPTGEIRCGNCGFVNNKRAKYCKNCGAQF